MPTVLITGANRGIGLEFARQYAADKWAVIACCRDASKAGELKAIPGIRIEILETSDASSLTALAAKLKDTAIDLLINNAGIYSGGGGSLGSDKSQTFGTIDAAAWEQVLRVNTIAPIMTVQALLPNLKKGEGKKIVNITSRMGSLSEMGSDSIAYRSSKTALNGAMRAAMHDLTKDKISIYNFHPGWVQTDMGGKAAHLTPPQSVAAMRKAIASLAAQDSGQFLNYDGAVIPW